MGKKILDSPKINPFLVPVYYIVNTVGCQ